MMEGKVRAALRTITTTANSGVFLLTKEVREALIKKHPRKQPLVSSAMTEPDTPLREPHFIAFEKIDGHMIRETALKTDGAAGPSGLDALLGSASAPPFPPSLQTCVMPWPLSPDGSARHLWIPVDSLPSLPVA